MVAASFLLDTRASSTMIARELTKAITIYGVQHNLTNVKTQIFGQIDLRMTCGNGINVMVMTTDFWMVYLRSNEFQNVVKCYINS